MSISVIGWAITLRTVLVLIGLRPECSDLSKKISSSGVHVTTLAQSGHRGPVDDCDHQVGVDDSPQSFQQTTDGGVEALTTLVIGLLNGRDGARGDELDIVPEIRALRRERCLKHQIQSSG